MEQYKDFRNELTELVGKRVRLCFFLDSESVRNYTLWGWIRTVNGHSMTFENDPQKGDAPITLTHLNLGAIVVYAVDIVPDDADVSDEEETQDYVGEATEFIPYDSDGKPAREPQEGYVILHKDHIYAKGTVYTKLPQKQEDGEE